MDAIFGLFAILCLLATPILTIIFLVQWIRRKPKKKIGVALISVVVGFWAILIVGIALDPSTWCEHQYEIESKLEATCTDEGYTLYRCPKCNDDKRDNPVAALGHDFKKISSKDATVESKGEIVYECFICDAKKTEILDILRESEEKNSMPSESQAENDAPFVESSMLIEKQPSTSLENSTETFTIIAYSEIYNEFKRNELAAKEAYNGNRYKITATINGMNSDGLFNLTGGATLTMETKVGNTIVFFLAEFEKNQEGHLKQVSVGDTISFIGTCYDGTFSDCELEG